MALELRQQQKLSQQLVFTLQMQQAIKLLQLNHQEMVDLVKTELVENPALEEAPDVAPRDGGVDSDRPTKATEPSDGQPAQEPDGTDWAKMLEQSVVRGVNQNAAGPSRFDDLPPIEQLKLQHLIVGPFVAARPTSMFGGRAAGRHFNHPQPGPPRIFGLLDGADSGGNEGPAHHGGRCP